MDQQTNLYDNITILEGNEKKDPNSLIKCFQSQLTAINYLTLEELFSGFHTIKVITFSYDIHFINEIMEFFDYGEILLGGNFLIQKDAKMQNLLAEICTNVYEAGKAIRNYDKLVQMLSEGNIEFRTPTDEIDHRKLYLLESDDGRTRVIKASANMSKQAWNNDHLEHYEYDDTRECYEAYLKDFETAWLDSKSITMDVISSKKADDLIEGNAILKKVKETGQTIVLQQKENELSIDNVKYTIDHEIIKEKYKELLNGIDTKAKNGVFEIIPKMIQKIEYNQKKLYQKNIKVNMITEKYPSLTFDIYNREIKLNDTPLNINPTEEEVKHDIDILLNIFNNFDDFIAPNVEKLKFIHFKLMNAILCSPFHAKVRCVAKLRDKSSSSLPLFALIASEQANNGKTFMIRAALKMMTGKEIDFVNATSFSKDNIRTAQLGIKGVPFMIDEIDNKYLSNIKDIIKNPEKCEENQIEDMPMFLFASNNVLKPDETIRKRMIFFTTEASLPSTIDKIAYESRGKAIIKSLGTAFYREYAKRMMDKVREEIDYLIYSDNVPKEYYSDLLSTSSEIILSILSDFGYIIPTYMKKLTWQKDYSQDSYTEDVIEEISEFLELNKKNYSLTKSKVIIEVGMDKESTERLKSWKNMLPSEMKASMQMNRNCSKLIIDRKELETKLGYNLGRFSLFRKK